MRYQEIVEVYEELSKTTKTLEKTHIIAKFLKYVSIENLRDIIYLLQGKVFPSYCEKKIGFSRQLSLKAIERASGSSSREVMGLWKRKGDLGKVAEDLIKDKKQRTLFREELTVRKVIENIRKLASLEGAGTVDKKIALVAELLSHSTSFEAKYIIRTVIEELRVGIASGILRDAIAEAFDVKKEDVENAYNSLTDYAEVAELAKEHKLQKGKGKIGRPLKVMLSVLVKNVEEGFEALGKPAQFEWKYDGFRLQVHKSGNIITLFTRRLENVTKQFPDIVEYVKNHVHGDEFILDGEAVAYDKNTKKYLPFQILSQRIKRKYDISEMIKKYPVELNLFDVLYYKDKSLINEILKKRREVLERIVRSEKGKLVLTKKLVTDDTKKAQEFYKEAIENGLEGVMIKNLDSNYKAGRYVGGWCKLKESLEPLDLVIVGAEWGTGKRAGMLSSFVLGCRHGDEFLECGMMGTGIKEKKPFKKELSLEKKPRKEIVHGKYQKEGEGVTFKELTQKLKPLIVEEKNRKVKIKPKVVVEVEYEEIQKSPTYSSGYALRFPRLKQVRRDKNAEDANTLKDIERIYKVQRGR